MKTLGMVLVIVAIGVGACEKSTTEPAQATQQSAPVAKNAGEAYAKIFQEMGTATSTVDPDNLGQDEALVRVTPQIEQLIEQSKATECDFAADYSKGVLADLPHVSQLRAFTRILSADTKRLVAAGDGDAACKRIAATMRLASQLTRSAHSQVELFQAVSMTNRAASNVIESPKLATAAWKTDVQNAIVEVTDVITNLSLKGVQREFELIARDLRENNMPDLSKDEYVPGKNWPLVSAGEREEAAKNVEAFGKEIAQLWKSSDAADKIKSMIEAREGKLGMDLLGVTWKLRKSIEETKTNVSKAASVLNK